MKLARILSALDENRVRATVDAVAELADVSAGNLPELLAADHDRAGWVVTPESYRSVTSNGHEHDSSASDNPTVIRDAKRLRLLVLATELTASIP